MGEEEGNFWDVNQDSQKWGGTRISSCRELLAPLQLLEGRRNVVQEGQGMEKVQRHLLARVDCF